MKIDYFTTDGLHLLPCIIYYNDMSWTGFKSIDLCFLKWGVSFIIKEHKWD